MPLEGKVRLQINLKVDRSSNIQVVKNFRDFVFPIMWLEEVKIKHIEKFKNKIKNIILSFQGIADLTPEIRRWLYLGTVFAPTAIPIISYGMIISGIASLIFIFVRAYQRFIFQSDPTTEILEMGRRTLRRGSSFIMHHQRFMMQRESYTLLRSNPSDNNCANLSHKLSNNSLNKNSSDSNNNFNNNFNKEISDKQFSTSSNSSDSDSRPICAGDSP